MGNKTQVIDNHSLLKRFQRLGSTSQGFVKLVDINSKRELMYRQISSTNRKEFETRRVKIKQLLQINIQAQHLVKIIQQYQNLSQQYCSEQYRNFIIFDLPHQNLLDQLQNRIALNKRFDQIQLWSILVSVVFGMAAMQKKGMKHQSISLDNIFVGKDGSIKIADPWLTDTLPNLKRHAMLKKWVYLAPNQIYRQQMSDIQSYKADVFSLGVNIMALGLCRSMDGLYNQQNCQIIPRNVHKCLNEFSQFFSQDIKDLIEQMLKPQVQRVDWLDIEQAILHQDSQIESRKLSASDTIILKQSFVSGKSKKLQQQPTKISKGSGQKLSPKESPNKLDSKNIGRPQIKQTKVIEPVRQKKMPPPQTKTVAPQKRQSRRPGTVNNYRQLDQQSQLSKSKQTKKNIQSKMQNRGIVQIKPLPINQLDSKFSYQFPTEVLKQMTESQSQDECIVPKQQLASKLAKISRDEEQSPRQMMSPVVQLEEQQNLMQSQARIQQSKISSQQSIKKIIKLQQISQNNLRNFNFQPMSQPKRRPISLRPSAPSLDSIKVQQVSLNSSSIQPKANPTDAKQSPGIQKKDFQFQRPKLQFIQNYIGFKQKQIQLPVPPKYPPFNLQHTQAYKTPTHISSPSKRSNGTNYTNRYPSQPNHFTIPQSINQKFVQTAKDYIVKQKEILKKQKNPVLLSFGQFTPVQLNSPPHVLSQHDFIFQSKKYQFRPQNVFTTNKSFQENKLPSPISLLKSLPPSLINSNQQMQYIANANRELSMKYNIPVYKQPIFSPLKILESNSKQDDALTLSHLNDLDQKKTFFKTDRGVSLSIRPLRLK